MTAPDYDDADLDLEDEQDSPQLDRRRLRSLERDAKKFRQADEELAALKRENAFIKAGINPDTDPKLRYFMSGYDGEVTAEAIRSAAESAGFITATSTETTPEQAAQERVSAASAGAAAAGKTDPVAELYAADREGGREAVLAQIRKHGHNII